MTPLLDIQNLSVTFRAAGERLHAVRGVSFQIHPGEAVGLVGESGCGKSATAKAIARLVSNHTTEIRGKVLFHGRDLLSLSEKAMCRVRGKEIGTIFQDPLTSMNPTQRIGTQIAEGFRLHNPGTSKEAARARALELLHVVGVPEPERRIDEYPHTLSGGLRQRAMIALSLAGNPKLLLADEPTTALDVTIQAQILELLKELKRDLQMSVLLITHDLGVVAGFCDRVLVMYGGKIVESGPVDALFQEPRHPYTRRLLRARPRLDLPASEPLIPIEGTPPLLHKPFPGCTFCPRCPEAMEICALHDPPLMDVGEGHMSSCWRHDARST